MLEEKRFERVGGTQEIEVNVRILTATNKDLHAAVAEKTFREDLYFRISAVPITIPPLRDSGDDVILLAEHFLERFRREFRKPSLNSPKKLASDCAPIRGPEMSANCRTLSSAPPSSRMAPRSTRRHCNCLPRDRPRNNCPSEWSKKNFCGKGLLKKYHNGPWPTWNDSKFECAAGNEVEQDARRGKIRRLIQNSASQNP